MRRVFLDMDGVLVDSIPYLLNYHDLEHCWEEWGQGNYDIYSNTGMSSQDFFDVDATVWFDMPKTEWADELVDLCLDNFDTFIITSSFPEAMRAKYMWLQKYYKDFNMNKIIFTWRKELLANRNDVLVEDYMLNAQLWEENGGTALICPQPWNNNNDIDHVFRSLKGMI